MGTAGAGSRWRIGNDAARPGPPRPFDTMEKHCVATLAGLFLPQDIRGVFMAGPAERRQSVGVSVGGVMVGGGAPVVVQSMTNTDTADIDATVKQVMQLARAGSEIVRITVDRDESAAAVPIIRDRLAFMGYDVPLVGDFHYIGHKLLTD